ncbi:MAG: D-alanyl-D-alanine carboxypeptidase/D-alanyl-D-alanine-endopeptidase [Chitinophagaceae bacterium]|nr:D-alanyl-D-alanine carboxypeptidase/D-alanyl-D-alanine-endopeptidase [Chitinophagaceae bacterium]
MKKVFLLVAGFLLLDAGIVAQAVSQRLQKAFTAFEKDEQLKHAISSLYVIDAKTGQVVFDKNAQVGLAPASTQKIITSVTAFELLGKEYRYKTDFAIVSGVLIVGGSYDPSFGSWRYASTKDSMISEKIFKELKTKKVNSLSQLLVYGKDIGLPPTGWINEDIGNYYGAAPHSFNWKENQYEMKFIPSKTVGDPAVLDTAGSSYWWQDVRILNECKTGPVGSGDNAYIYFVPGISYRVVKGTVPAGVKSFSISGTDPIPEKTFVLFLKKYLAKNNLFNGEQAIYNQGSQSLLESNLKTYYSFSYYSPPLDSIIYWFNKKSINLYGEALIKTFAYEKQGFGSTDSGVAIVKKFWKEKGLDEDELNIYDGSGLSPLNRVTTHAQVEILKYAKTKDWFQYFYNSLPDYNGMKMKSGTISDVKGFCGYHKSKDGREYIFSFLVNNYSGKSSQLVGKMYKVLDELK